VFKSHVIVSVDSAHINTNRTEPNRKETTLAKLGPGRVLVERFSRFGLFLCGWDEEVGKGAGGIVRACGFHYLPNFKLGARTAAHGIIDLENNFLVAYLNISFFFVDISTEIAFSKIVTPPVFFLSFLLYLILAKYLPHRRFIVSLSKLY